MRTTAGIEVASVRARRYVYDRRLSFPRGSIIRSNKTVHVSTNLNEHP